MNNSNTNKVRYFANDVTIDFDDNSDVNMFGFRYSKKFKHIRAYYQFETYRKGNDDFYITERCAIDRKYNHAGEYLRKLQKLGIRLNDHEVLMLIAEDCNYDIWLFEHLIKESTKKHANKGVLIIDATEMLAKHHPEYLEQLERAIAAEEVV